MSVTDSARSGGIIGYLFHFLKHESMLCVLIRTASLTNKHWFFAMNVEKSRTDNTGVNSRSSRVIYVFGWHVSNLALFSNATKTTEVQSDV